MTVFRREGLRMVPWYMAAFILWTIVGLLAVALVVGFLPLQVWSPSKVIFLAAAAALLFPLFKLTFAVMKWIRNFRTSFMAIDQLGLRLRIPGTGETSLGWPEVTGVRHEKQWITLDAFIQLRCRVDAYTVSTTGSPLTFSTIDIPSPKRAAREIASRIGSEIVTAPAGSSTS